MGCLPRGGSTWLAEILGSLPEYEMIWEPFHVGWSPQAKRHGFRTFNYIPGRQFSDRQREYVSALLRGHLVTAGHLGPTAGVDDILSVAQASNFVLKCTDAMMMIHLLYREQPMPTVLMIRHPCAVVASQLAHGAWEQVHPENQNVQRDVARILENRPEWKSTWAACSTQEEVLAFIWACQVAIPLRQPEVCQWHVMTYERLVRNSRGEIERLFSYLDREPSSSVYDHIEKPSATTRGDSNVVKGGDPLRTWRRRLDSEQVDQILSVVHEIGVSFYSNDLRPNMEGIKSFVYNDQDSS